MYDITWLSEEALEAATSGVDINDRHFELQLLGRRTIDVSIFVACEFPDHYLVDLLENYGDFNDETICHLKTQRRRSYTH